MSNSSKLNIFACSGLSLFRPNSDSLSLSNGLETTKEFQDEIIDSDDFTLDSGSGLSVSIEKEKDDEDFVLDTDGKGLWVGVDDNGKYVSEYLHGDFVQGGTDNALWASLVVFDDLNNSGWQDNETLRKYLGSSGDGGCAEYFLYTFIPEDDVLKYPSIIAKKRELQLKTYQYVLEIFTGYQYGTERDMIEIIRNGIEETFGRDVETVLYEIKIGKREAIGVPLATEAIIAIISAVLSVVLAVITGVIEYCKTKSAAKYTAPSYQDLVDSVPDSTDIIGNSKSSNKHLWLLAAAGAVILLLGNKDKDKNKK